MRNKLFQEALEQVPEHTRVFIRKYTDLVDRIHELMNERGYLQKDLAHALDKQESEISKWLSGSHNLTFRTIAKLEVALGAEIIAIPGKRVQSQPDLWKKTNYQGMTVYSGNIPNQEAEEIDLSSFRSFDGAKISSSI